MLVTIHALIFIYLPITGNKLRFNKNYCDPTLMTGVQKCNDINDNASILIFYLIFCLYFYLSSL